MCVEDDCAVYRCVNNHARGHDITPKKHHYTLSLVTDLAAAPEPRKKQKICHIQQAYTPTPSLQHQNTILRKVDNHVVNQVSTSIF